MHIRAFLAGSMLAALLAACGGPSRQTTPDPAAARPDEPRAVPPRLVLLLVVDQLPSWWFEARREHFSGGFARLVREGVYYPEAEYPYAVTFTAAGHAALGTGAPPADTGIADNERWMPNEDQGKGKELPAARDVDSPVFVLAGNPPRDGRSSAALLVDGVADVLENTNKAARTVTISIKDRSAIFVGGRQPDLAIWFDETQPAMTTSEHYVDAPPDWLRALAQQGQVTKYQQYVWNPLQGIAHRAITGVEDREPGDTINDKGLGNAFPHDLGKSQQWTKDVQATPAGDLLVLETARAAIEHEQLGADEVPDFLALSFSSPDVVGHYWGPDSWERLDILVRLDRELERFLSELDQRFGPQGYAVVLTSDHGITPVVEITKKRGGSAYRYERKDLKAVAEAAVDGLLRQGKGDWIAFVSDNSVFISAELAQHPRRAEALDKVIESIRALPGIQYAERTERLGGNCETRQGLERLACYSVVPKEPGEIYFAAAPKSITTKHPQGTNHGSPNPDDRIVPIIVHAPGDPRWARPRIAHEPVNTLQVAPTLAALLGIAAPPAARHPALP